MFVFNNIFTLSFEKYIYSPWKCIYMWNDNICIELLSFLFNKKYYWLKQIIFSCKQNIFHPFKKQIIISFYHTITKSGFSFVSNPPQNVWRTTCNFQYSPNFKQVNLIQFCYQFKIYWWNCHHTKKNTCFLSTAI